MNGVDYSRRLSKEREYFKDSLKKNNEANQKRLEETEARHNLVQDKASKNYLNDKVELEKSYQKNLSNISDKNQESLNNQTDKFNKDLKEERESFARDSVSKSKDFDQRLKDIRQNYNRAFKNQDETDSTIRETEKKRYSGNVKELVRKQDQQLKKYQDEVSGAGTDIKDAFKREKQQLIRNQEEILTDTHRKHYDEKESVKNRLSGELKKIKEVHEHEQNHLREYTGDKIVKTEKHHSEKSEKLAQDYSERYAKDAKNQQIATLKNNKQYEESLDKVRRESQEQIRQSDNMVRRRDNGGNELSAAAAKTFNGQGPQELKVRNMKNALDETRRTYEDKAATDATDYNVAMKEERAENQALLDKKINQYKSEKILTVGEERVQNQDRLDHQERQNLARSKDYERQVMMEKKSGDTRVKNLKENFHKSMTLIEEKLRENINDVTLSANADKKEFMKLTSERTMQQLADMKAEFNRQLDQTIQGYEFRLSGAEKKFAEYQMSAEQKMASMAQQSEKELDYERTTGAERRNAEVRGLKSAIDEQEHKHRMEVNNMMVNFQKQIAKTQSQSDLKLKLMSNDFETKLKEAQASKSRELTEKENINRAEMERLKASYSDDKQKTVADYETKLQQLKDHHETQMQQLNEFKKLS